MGSVTLIAEWGQSHLGRLDLALRQVAITKAAGWDVYKTQLFDPDLLCGPTAKRYWHEGLGGSASQRETFVDNGFLSLEDLLVVKATCDAEGVVFCATPFDLPSVDLLEDLEVKLVKVASADLTFHHLLRRVAKMHVPIVLSTGAAKLSEVVRAVDVLEQAGVADLTLLSCTLSYPTTPSQAHLRRMGTLAKLGHRVGYSDHTTITATACAATALGAAVLEKHCTLGTVGSPCPDDSMAIGPEGMAEYLDLAIYGAAMRGDKAFYPRSSELAARDQARRSAHAAYDIAAGEALDPVDLIWKRPAVGGYTPDQEDELVGRRLKHPVTAGEQITEAHLSL